VTVFLEHKTLNQNPHTTISDVSVSFWLTHFKMTSAADVYGFMLAK